MSELDTTPTTLFEPYRLGNIPLRNRVLLSPMTRVSAEADGTVSKRVAEYYRIFAAGGFAAVVTEGSYIDTAHSQTYLHQPGLARDEHIESWRSVTDAVHTEGAAVIAQLQHAGPQSQGNPHTTGVRGPSDIAAKGEQLAMYRGSGPYGRPTALTVGEISEIRKAFVAAARRAQKAGFDGVEIHGANGYLLDAFLTDYFNHRNDQYGSSVANRVRLAVEVVHDVREAVGDSFVIGIRISQGKVSDLRHKWSGGVEDARTIFGALSDSEVDYIHTTEPVTSDPAFPDHDPRSLAALASEFAPNVTIIANGGLDTGDTAAHLIDSGQADLVTIGKSALANRDWPTRVRESRQLHEPFAPSRFGDLATVQDWELDAERLLTAQHSTAQRRHGMRTCST
ncbi:NADH:flavin oxidoreductase [Rhodococcus jostii]|uniref:NADH:flavin oxidoreductase n=1 Tax=Rhodococcus jostii TaxID=132919 RepID=UPI0036527A23